ncbi:MAG: enolase C-terminal domain-like protein [bacterium]|nr:enolase C-terminal domain-like protein [bacterium]
MSQKSNSGKIKGVSARIIPDSRKKPTIEVEMETDLGNFKASAPSGISTGKYEATMVGAEKAKENIEKIIAPALSGKGIANQEEIDKILIDLDGTGEKSRLGANAILPVSLACCRAGASLQNLPLYGYIARLAGNSSQIILPRPSFNLIEGGRHSDSGLAFQEFMIVPAETSFYDNLAAGKKIYQKLKDIAVKQFREINLSAEGALAVPLSNARAALDLILEAVSGQKVGIALDAAASSFYLDGSYQISGKAVSSEELAAIYQYLASRYPIISIEDPFQEEDFENFAELKNKIGESVTIFGDDLTVSNIERIKLAEEKGSCNGLILKPNQIGTVTETLRSAKLAKSYGWKIMVANRAGETEDDFIADLAVGIGAEFVKSGAPFPKERMAKYDRLSEIEKDILKK